MILYRLTVPILATTVKLSSTTIRAFSVTSTPTIWKTNTRTTRSTHTKTTSLSMNMMLDLTALSTKITQDEKNRQEAFDLASRLKVSLAKIRRTIDVSTTSTSSSKEESSSNNNEMMKEVDGLVKKSTGIKREMQPPSLFYAVQDYIKFQSYDHFLNQVQQNEQSSNNNKLLESLLIPPSTFHSKLTLPPSQKYDLDEDYLMGIMSLTQDLARYSILRGTLRDSRSITLARNLVEELLEYCMGYDFRNGMLRRRYDGVKYALKTSEMVLYELSVTDSNRGSGDDGDGDGDEPATKRAKVEETERESGENGSIMTELIELKKRIEHRDDVRETLIKKCRDAQKKAKNAIFALHRNDSKRASKLLEECEGVMVKDLVPIVEAEPSLRYGGSFGCVMEEYAEAKLFQAWISGEKSGGESKDVDMEGTKNNRPACVLLQPEQITVRNLSLSTEEYLGGLCDLTGEVGRYAVQRGTARDATGVKLCLDTNTSILFSLETLERFPASSGLGKKMGPLRQSVEKIERMLYELSLVEATGRNFVADSIKHDPQDNEED